ncbi:hypothetical protein EOA33_14350 [Mesorhizobium sp. M4A.F.Ca.ET.050.02.1.1]|uniref:hypothetical protein n=1 Tax=Mesorhizobium sp. M4A.F.Ca.ET.050.02.1.1 TaxID=2496754 RepID=UPI000FCAC212|nr:hypothetical protein [Mesorhizobium sp. M4A.F.Ca.ET.050.02.1.1]RUX48856.1 hypothetical protein EOA33_14350 [Mesorhizobium sp. M4A.F.Ca.ET.050.02.1.1]TIT95680.1 MAG: hypothetical protein E5W59_01370 [Mesorhizobium sp.]
MNAHATVTEQPTETWQFELDALVTHRDMPPMPSIVLSRVRTSKGQEVYGVRSLAFEDPNRDRLIMGEVLKPIDDVAWDVCLLAGTSLDPRATA